MHNFTINKNLQEFSGKGQYMGKVSTTKASAIKSRFYQIQQTGHTDGENRMIFYTTNYGRLGRNAHRMKLYTVGACAYLGFFHILKGANLSLVFKLREICSVDSEKNLPPDARF